MDLQKLFSLFKDQNINIPNEKGNATNTLDSTLANLDLSSINQNVIEQVKREYMTSADNKKEDEFENVEILTPNVLIHIANMAKNTNLLQVIKQHSERQEKTEKELFEHRKSIVKRYEDQKKSLLAKELIGIYDPRELKSLERDCQKELHRMDIQVLKEMDKQTTHLQRDLIKLKVPLFKETQQKEDIRLQQKILAILQIMIQQ